MKKIFDTLSYDISKKTTRKYSTSFSLGIRFLDAAIQQPIYNIYGFVRFADEIVDSFHGFDNKTLLQEFKNDTHKAIERKISLNPVLNSFQETVNAYNIPLSLVDTFLKSMEMDIHQQTYSYEKYKEYILGSAEVVGLMCLMVFVNGNKEKYNRLKPSAMKLGSAFQKINFLRDLKADYNELGRVYFPGINMNKFCNTTKKELEADIEKDFQLGLEGIKLLPKNARFGTYIAYIYYHKLFKKIKGTSAQVIMNKRVRIPNNIKYFLFFSSYVRHNLNLI